jgi:hypothetical protein
MITQEEIQKIKNEIINYKQKVLWYLGGFVAKRMKMFSQQPFGLLIIPKRRGGPYDDPKLYYELAVPVYKPVYVWFDSILVVSQGWGSKSHISSILYNYTWPECGCKFSSREDSIARRGVSTKDAVPFVIDFISEFMGDIVGKRGELYCPRCQTCDETVDYMCEGFVEDTSSLAGEQGKILWLKRKGPSEGPFVEIEGEVLGRMNHG